MPSVKDITRPSGDEFAVISSVTTVTTDGGQDGASAPSNLVAQLGVAVTAFAALFGIVTIATNLGSVMGQNGVDNGSNDDVENIGSNDAYDNSDAGWDEGSGNNSSTDSDAFSNTDGDFSFPDANASDFGLSGDYGGGASGDFGGGDFEGGGDG